MFGIKCGIFYHILTFICLKITVFYGTFVVINASNIIHKVVSVHILGQRTDSSAAGSIVFNQIYKFRQIDNSGINKD